MLQVQVGIGVKRHQISLWACSRRVCWRNDSHGARFRVRCCSAALWLASGSTGVGAAAKIHAVHYLPVGFLVWHRLGCFYQQGETEMKIRSVLLATATLLTVVAGPAYATNIV